ncbi:MAG: TatD family hydrolase [Alloprevotella sp.]|nr:TatD family hydrolase [Alloprevotella sp.]
MLQSHKPFAFIPSDVHTHRQNDLSANAIISLPCDILRQPENFHPVEGLHYSVGIHPWWTSEADIDDLWQNMLRLLVEPSVVAIGECGLDKLRGKELAVQELWFKRHILQSESMGIPLIIHCVRAYDRLLQIYKQVQPTQPWIVHGFRGGPQLAEQLLAAGMYLSFGRRFNKESYALTPPDRRFVESDDEPFGPQESWYE